MKKVMAKYQNKGQVKTTKKTGTSKPVYKKPWPKPSTDSTDYYHEKHLDMNQAFLNTGDSGYVVLRDKALADERRQRNKRNQGRYVGGFAGFDKNGFPIPASKMKKTGGSTGMDKYQKKGEVKPAKKASTTTFNKYGETANKAMYRMTGTDTTKNQYAYDKSGKMIKVKKMGGMVKSKKK